jgi:large subunit ribosomal protein L22
MKAAEAVTQLQFSGKAAARPVVKLIQSAMANAAHNHSMVPESLVIAEAFVDGGPTLYRSTPRAMGRSAPIRKRTSHITIVLTGTAAEAKPKKRKTKATKDATAEAPEADAASAEKTS